jgi:hypothetical protein
MLICPPGLNKLSAGTCARPHRTGNPCCELVDPSRSRFDACVAATSGRGVRG